MIIKIIKIIEIMIIIIIIIIITITITIIIIIIKKTEGWSLLNNRYQSSVRTSTEHYM